MKSSHPGGDAHSQRFATTRWSIVLAAQNRESAESRAALEDLCATYWYPVYAYIRRRGYPAHDAQDLTQAFFARLLEKDYLKAVDSERGRFRTFLLTAVSRFVSNQREHSHAVKRGGGNAPFSIDFSSGEERYCHEPADRWTPERLFDRRWVLTLLETVLKRLEQEYIQQGKGPLFERLRVYITADGESGSYRDVADALASTEGAVKVAVHRLRRRYRELLRDEIAATVDSADDVDDELNRLFESLASSSR